MHMELTQTNNSLMFHTFETKVVYILGTWHMSSWKTKKNDCNSLILKDIYLLKTENIIHNNYSTYQTYTTILIMKINNAKLLNVYAHDFEVIPKNLSYNHIKC